MGDSVSTAASLHGPVADRGDVLRAASQTPDSPDADDVHSP